MYKRMTIMLLAVALLFGGIFGIKWFQEKKKDESFANFRPPPVTVSAAYALEDSWNPYLTSVGTLGARYGVDVSAEAEGLVSAIKFISGQEVKKGDMLLEIDDSVEQANLKSFEAQLKLAKLNYERDKQMIEKKLTSQNQFDRSLAELEEAIARVEQTRASLAKKKVRAPFSGRMGILQVDLGQFISTGTGIGSLQSLATLHLDFSLPEKDLPSLFVGQTATFKVDAYPEKIFEAELFAIDSRVDSDTRTIQVRAKVDNEERLLVPGMFAAVTLILEPAQRVVLLPKTAVTYSLYGEEVFIVEEQVGEDGKKRLVVNRKSVKAGQQLGNQIVILAGVLAGQMIVIDGQLKLSNGAEISLANGNTLGEGATP